MYNEEFAAQLAGSEPIDINIYKKKDPEQDYSGFGYAMNNLFRKIGNGGLGSINPIKTDGAETGYGNPNGSYFGTIAQIGLPFAADLIWGNKYREVD